MTRSHKSPKEVPDTTRADERRFDLDDNVIRLLLLGFRVSEGYWRGRAADEGFGDIRMTHIPIMRAIKFGVTRMADIAEGAGITRQTAGALALELEKLGYTERHPDPQDGRAKVVRFTERGQAFIHRFPVILQQAEEDLAGIVGPADLDHLSRILHAIVDSAGDPARRPAADGRPTQPQFREQEAR